MSDEAFQRLLYISFLEGLILRLMNMIDGKIPVGPLLMDEARK